MIEEEFESPFFNRRGGYILRFPDFGNDIIGV